MLDIKKTAEELNQMLHDTIMKGSIIVPINKHTFKYKNYLIVRDQSGGWSVCKLGSYKMHIASTFLKVTAFAICIAHANGRLKTVEELISEDAVFERNYNDSMFFQNTYKVSKDYEKKDTALWRYEIVHSKARFAKQKIDRIFYSSIA